MVTGRGGTGKAGRRLLLSSRKVGVSAMWRLHKGGQLAFSTELDAVCVRNGKGDAESCSG